MNKKGFVLMETILVIVIISVSLLTLFSSYNKILTKMKAENRFDNPEYLYMTYHIKERLGELSGFPTTSDIYNFAGTVTTPTNLMTKFSTNEQKVLKSIFNVKYIYIVKGINSSTSETSIISHLNKFPPSVVEYVKKLDVSARDELIVVVFERPELDDNGSPKQIYCSTDITTTNRTYCNNTTNDNYLKKTYVASLKWGG